MADRVPEWTPGPAWLFCPADRPDRYPKALAVAESDGTIRLYDTAKWGVTGEFPGPRDRVTTLAFGPDGRLYSGSVTATVLAWDHRAAKPPAERK